MLAVSKMVTIGTGSIYTGATSGQYNARGVGKNLKVKLTYIGIADPRNAARFLNKIQLMASPKSKKSN